VARVGQRSGNTVPLLESTPISTRNRALGAPQPLEKADQHIRPFAKKIISRYRPSQRVSDSTEKRPRGRCGVLAPIPPPGPARSWQWAVSGRRPWNGWSCWREQGNREPGKLLPLAPTDGNRSPYSSPSGFRPPKPWFLMARSWWLGFLAADGSERNCRPAATTSLDLQTPARLSCGLRPVVAGGRLGMSGQPAEAAPCLPAWSDQRPAGLQGSLSLHGAAASPWPAALWLWPNPGPPWALPLCGSSMAGKA